MARKVIHLMGRLSELEIENFRCFKQRILKFENPKGDASSLIVLAGPNGSGKTAILEAGLIAAGYDEPGFEKRGNGEIRIGAVLGRIKAKFQLQDRAAWVEILFRADAKPVCEWESESGIFASEKPFEIPCMYFSSWRSPRLIGALPITAGKRGRRPSNTEENRLWNAKQYLVNARAHASMGVRLPEVLSKYDEIITRLNETWSLFYRDRGQVFSVAPVSDDPESGFDVFLHNPDGRKVSVDLLSSGQLEVFTFSSSLLRSSFEAGIIFVDEPELHLDPQWHGVLLRAIRKLKPESQIIVATHSPLVFDSARSYERHFLVPDEDPRVTTWGDVDSKAL